MSVEKRARQEIEELRGHIRRLQESERRDRRKLAEDDALRKIKRCEDLIAELQKGLAAQKQVRYSNNLYSATYLSILQQSFLYKSNYILWSTVSQW